LIANQNPFYVRQSYIKVNTGLLYLENNLTAGAFTSSIRSLTTLSAQAAISIENACLYNDLEDYNRTLEAKWQSERWSYKQKIYICNRSRERKRERTDAANRAKSEFWLV